jgi:hypothetical protein
MKKIYIFCIALLLGFTNLVFADRKEIQDFFESYEYMITTVENLAQQPLVTLDDLVSAISVEGKYKNISYDAAWTEEDNQHVSELTNRLMMALKPHIDNVITVSLFNAIQGLSSALQGLLRINY